MLKYILKRIGYYNEINIKGTSKYTPKKYDTPKELGKKWQIDVKFVPKECKADTIPKDLNFYQYTCLDEASRERFIYPYKEQSSYSTIDFVKRAIIYFGYQPKIIQTDNGYEFTYTSKPDRVHPFDILCLSLNIEHKLNL